MAENYTLADLRAHLVEAFAPDCCIIGNTVQAVIVNAIDEAAAEAEEQRDDHLKCAALCEQFGILPSMGPSDAVSRLANRHQDLLDLVASLTAERDASRAGAAMMVARMQEEVVKLTAERDALKDNLTIVMKSADLRLTKLNAMTAERDQLRAQSESWRLAHNAWQTWAAETLGDGTCGDEVARKRITVERDAMRAEVERLTGCLRRANDSTEHFERLWYLVQDERDAMRAVVEAAIEYRRSNLSMSRSRSESSPTGRLLAAIDALAAKES